MTLRDSRQHDAVSSLLAKWLFDLKGGEGTRPESDRPGGDARRVQANIQYLKNQRNTSLINERSLPDSEEVER
jgi:hypothetical protein